MADRLEAFRRLCEEHGVEPGDRNTTAGEDTGLYFLPEDDEDHKPLKRWVAITTTGEYAYLYADFDTRIEASRQAVANVNDSIWAETPLLLVNLDTGERYGPRMESLQWRRL